MMHGSTEALNSAYHPINGRHIYQWLLDMVLGFWLYNCIRIELISCSLQLMLSVTKMKVVLLGKLSLIRKGLCFNKFDEKKESNFGLPRSFSVSLLLLH